MIKLLGSDISFLNVVKLMVVVVALCMCREGFLSFPMRCEESEKIIDEPILKGKIPRIGLITKTN